MKYAVLSDIHGNLEALSPVLEKCREEGVEEYISLYPDSDIRGIMRDIQDDTIWKSNG